MHILVHLVNSCLEIGDSYISDFVGLIFPFNFLGVSDTPA